MGSGSVAAAFGVDARRPDLSARLAGVDVVVHTAEPHRESGELANVLDCMAEAGVRRLVLVTSAMVYGALPDNTVPLPEDAPLQAATDSAAVAELLEAERIGAEAAQAADEFRVVVLRPAIVVGPGIDTVLTRHFEGPRLLHLKGSHPRWQFCHVDDLARAIEIAAVGGLDPAAEPGKPIVAAVGSEGWLESEEVEELTGRRRLEMPASVALLAAERMQRFGITPAAASQLSYVVHPWVVQPARLPEVGWLPRYSNAEALAEQLANGGARRPQRFDRKDAAAGAAVGATLAAVATAALVRRARKRRGL
jgi:nucleoside-diphosphate-sugar epimerase